VDGEAVTGDGGVRPRGEGRISWENRDICVEELGEINESRCHITVNKSVFIQDRSEAK